MSRINGVTTAEINQEIKRHNDNTFSATTLILLSVVMIIAGVVLAYFDTREFSDFEAFSKDKPTVSGVVLSVYTKEDRLILDKQTDKKYSIKARYVVSDKPYDAFYGSNDGRYANGDSIRIWYDSQNPQTSMIEPENKGSLWGFGLIILGALLFVGSVVFRIYMYLHRNRAEEAGLVADGFISPESYEGNPSILAYRKGKRNKSSQKEEQKYLSDRSGK